MLKFGTYILAFSTFSQVYVDTVGDPGKYQAKLQEIFPNLDITVAAKADADYQIVGAASICAKVSITEFMKVAEKCQDESGKIFKICIIVQDIFTTPDGSV